MELGVGFTDADGDGFVSWVNGELWTVMIGRICSKSDGENFVDDDCDGWIDDKLNCRPFENWWVYQTKQ